MEAFFAEGMEDISVREDREIAGMIALLKRARKKAKT